MPTAPPRPCPHPGCGRLHCPAHPQELAAWRTHRAPVPRVRGRRLQQLRAQLFAAEPWCVACLRLGRRTRATIRDHVIPLAEGGSDDEANVQALCQACSDAKTQAEAQRGMSRYGGGGGSNR
jgi:5-methylcytosine-specific restriction enzyme A